MTTLADITLRVAQEVTDVLKGSASVGAGAATGVTSITDTTYLRQPAGHWDGGTLWFRSGTGVSGIVCEVTSYILNVLGFASIGIVHPAVTAKYAVADKRFPYAELVKAVNTSLEDEGAYVLDTDTTLEGDGTTLEFTLPAGVVGVVHVEFSDTSDVAQIFPSHHWTEREGKLIFDTGFPPPDDYVINVWFREAHAELDTYNDEIDDEIDMDWLKWKSVENVLLWALNMYGDTPEKAIATKLQWALEKLEMMRPLRLVNLTIRTA